MTNFHDIQPDQLIKAEIQKQARAGWLKLSDALRPYTTRAVLAKIAAGAAGVVLGWISLSVLAAAICTAVVGVSLATVVVSQHLLYQERERRHWIEIRLSKRLEQQVLQSEQQVDGAVLQVMGDRSGSTLMRGRNRSLDLNQALATARARQITDARPTSPIPPKAAIHANVAPKGPDLNVVRRRMEKRATEIDALEAEIQALAVPEAYDLAKAADESRELAKAADKAAGDAAQDASVVARARRRNGQVPSPADAGVALHLTVDHKGARNVQRAEPPLTPEEIAAGVKPPAGKVA
jgi:hypothetical protein